MKFSLITTLLVAAVTATPHIMERTNKPAKIGRTVEILVSNGTKYIGCVSTPGRFTRDDLYCGLFQSFYTSGVDSYLWAYDYCHNTNGALNCTDYPNAAGAPQFYSYNGHIALDGPTGEVFSIDTFPNTTEGTSVPIYFGTIGKAANITLHWRAKQG